MLSLQRSNCNVCELAVGTLGNANNFLSASLSLDQYNQLKNNKIGDRIAIIDYWNENDKENFLINKIIELYYANYVIKTKILGQLINSESKLPSYEIRHDYREEPDYHDLNDDPYQSIELEIIEIINPTNKEEINEKVRYDYIGSKEYAKYMMMRNSYFTFY